MDCIYIILILYISFCQKSINKFSFSKTILRLEFSTSIHHILAYITLINNSFIIFIYSSTHLIIFNFSFKIISIFKLDSTFLTLRTFLTLVLTNSTFIIMFISYGSISSKFIFKKLSLNNCFILTNISSKTMHHVI